ncbi:epididymal protein 13 [Castor canadensis]|uniref:Epididymal protein 13 n=1 Tax=Castor canadensis TaxID=51338 RepID=A0AC58L8J4_CASCN
MIRLALVLRLLPDTCIPTVLKGLLSLQVLNDETSDCQDNVQLAPATTPSKKHLVRKSSWNFMKCAYMMVTFFFVSYNKGDWCYCHICSSEVDVRNDLCCSF